MEEKSFRQIALKDSTDWNTFSQEDKKYLAGPIAISFFYLGDYNNARQASRLHSLFTEEEYHENWTKSRQITMLFEIGLYSSLAKEQTKTNMYWQRVIEKRREFFPKNKVQEVKTAYVWIYEAYALLKLEQYEEVAEPAQIGFEGLLKGKGLYIEPHHNEIEYGLVDVMLRLSEYMLSPTETGKEQVQQALVVYKEENAKYGRRGYAVIFDLQFSYQDVFTPVLPGPDPEED